MKRCIFYLPYKLEENGRGARMLRPKKMIQAFRDIGYEVFVIEGLSKERRARIHEIERRIKSGEKYDFMYTESHTVPTLLTDPHHLPSHPLLDFGFFRFVRNHGIKIGLFYCDIYWKFDNYGIGLPAWKKYGAILNYKYDIKQYRKYLDKFYVPDLKVCDYLSDGRLRAIASELSPGAENIKSRREKKSKEFNLTVFYVGGLGSQYQIDELVKAISITDNTKLIICCREEEWAKERCNIEPYLCDRIEVIHKNGNELEPYYEEADICSLLFKKDIYREMAKPFKAFEYLAHEIPSLSTRGTAIGTFVEQNNIGWNIDFKADQIAETLNSIINNPAELAEKKNNCSMVKKSNLWTSRAQKVASDLL